jgi:hypothetical protein
MRDQVRSRLDDCRSVDALAETVNGLCEAERIHRRRTWPSATAVEIATPDRVTWWNTKRRHQAHDRRTPAEVEASHAHPMTTAPATVQSLNGTQCASLRRPGLRPAGVATGAGGATALSS